MQVMEILVILQVFLYLESKKLQSVFDIYSSPFEKVIYS